MGEMRVLVFGAKGWIGQQFCVLLDKSDTDYRGSCARADDARACEEEIDYFRPTHVVSFIGRTHGPGSSTIDYLEQKGKIRENVRDNLFGPLVLAKICEKQSIHFTYLGTGCIFEYDSVHPEGGKGFSEESRPNFYGSAYSVVKGYTDQLFSVLFPGVLNLRIRMPITACNSPRNFITKITSYKKICSNPNSMSVLPTLLPVMFSLMRSRTGGCMNFCNPGVISHNRVLELYKRIVDPTFTWDNFTIEEQDSILLAKRSNNFLDTSKLEDLHEVPSIEAAVVEVLTRMKKREG